MSFVFDADGETVWSPALRVGELFVRMHTDICSVLGLATGLTAIAADMYEIDSDLFERTTLAVYDEYFSSHNPALRSMLGATLGPAVRILERCRRPVTPRSDEERAFLSRAADLGMPR
ncbi:DUF6086 family protein [Nocardia thailandica]|uniref:DUF6086 family protein n=1 Tax=Nocardia thailandica TaxID=257275 RepID=A0ABW6PQL7_9NOCA|nr:DUF6086 family protein [Nocardia thailandica]